MYVGLTPDKRFLPGHLGMGLVEGEELGALRVVVMKLHSVSGPHDATVVHRL